MTKKAPKEQRIEGIIEAAISELVEKGYENTSMQSIAERAGLTKGGLYYHFNSKDEILIAANGRYLESVLELIKTAEATPCPVEALRCFIREYLDYWAKHARGMIFSLISLTKILACSEMWPLLNDYSTMMISFYERQFKEGINRQKFREHDPLSQATSLFTALEGATPYLIISGQLTPKGVAKQLEATFIDVLLTGTD